MEAVFILLPLALGMSLMGLFWFFWAVEHGQFDDLEGPRWRAVYDEDDQP